jgi:hypothetical protein
MNEPASRNERRICFSHIERIVFNGLAREKKPKYRWSMETFIVVQEVIDQKRTIDQS